METLVDFFFDGSFLQDLALEHDRFPSRFFVFWVGSVLPADATFSLPDVWFCVVAPPETAGVFGVTSLTSVPLFDLFPSLFFWFVGFGALLDAVLHAGGFSALLFVAGVGVVLEVLVDLFPSRGFLLGVALFFLSGVEISSFRLLFCVALTLLFDVDDLFGGVVLVHVVDVGFSSVRSAFAVGSVLVALTAVTLSHFSCTVGLVGLVSIAFSVLSVTFGIG